RADRLAVRAELAGTLLCLGAAPDGPVVCVGRAGHLVSVAQAVVKDDVCARPPVAGTLVAPVVRTEDLGTADTAVHDVVEQCPGGPAVVRPALGVGLFCATVEEDVRSGGVVAGDEVVPGGVAVAAHDEHVAGVFDVEGVPSPAGDL